MKQSSIPDKKKSVDVQFKMYPSHRTRMPVDIQIKIESDTIEGDDLCIDEDMNKEQDVKLDSNREKPNFFDYFSPMREYTIEFEDCDLDKVNPKIEKYTNIDESESKEQVNNNFLNENINQAHILDEDQCHVIVSMFQCNACKTTFVNQEDMLQHIRVLHGTTYQYKSLTSENSLKTVKELINVKTMDHYNDVMEKIEKDSKAAFENINKCRTKRRHSCTICNKEYSYKAWHSHMKEVHGDNNHECTICGEKFTCERYLKKHNLYKHENGVKASQKPNRQSCPECPKTFKNSDCLGQHIKNCHANHVECQLCFSRLKSPAYLKTHMRRVHYDDGKIHRCKICCKKLKSPRQVKIHMMNLHPGTLHPCPHCTRLLCNAAQLTTHLKKCKPKAQIIKDDEVDVTVDLTID